MTKTFRNKFLALLAILLLVPGANAQGQDPGSPFATLNDTLDNPFLPVDEAYRQDLLLSGSQLSAIFEIAPEYYLYREKLALYRIENGQKTKLPLSLPSGEVIWDDYFEKETEVYRGQLEFPIRLAETGKVVQLELHYQGCADAGLCYPPQTRHYSVDSGNGSIRMLGTPPRNVATPDTQALSPQENNSRAITVPLALLFAFAGGLLLNLMPCVFPVLSIKLLSVSQAAQSASQRHHHGWAYSIGVILSFVAIAAVMLALRAGGEAIGWGFQLQSPWLVAALAYLFFVMGLSLSGVTEFGSSLMGIGGHLNNSRGLRGSLASGALATLVASPCTAPLMGSALGFAVTQPAVLALSIFAALGAGMAAPFLLLTHLPTLTEKLPRPGPWMDRLKQLLAFPMYLTAVWLLWVLGRQTGGDGVALVLTGAVAIAFALWLWPRHQWRWLQGCVAAVALVLAALLLPHLSTAPQTQQQSSGYWQPYSAEKLDAARSEGRAVLANMTAAWCITCLANEQMVLSSDAVSHAIEQLGIVAFKGDWTNQDPHISALLAKYKRTSVPLYLLYPAGGGEAKILPQILSRRELLADLEAAARGGLSTSSTP
ncbi:protein-disulfide reductase DsbD [Microbulbifer sp. 2205BS26-8]|uniref:protein-disulfide reductase DsbD family protein n=1 Tax=Microbulbifer sp. 2205BS26-8 TaxID=3064386 RepID=UPI00273E0855|nr:protein-disulfide reductase DsbD [Microbulbifer sp. 2205BS26-8]MDP5208773.1 protein-disulfide reductase DsbD [Microbulbifer sp. 2205BS26-8]